ncbi:MAG: glycoside hydrolase, partial [Prevotellaceae bacterium]|nr:glycoside hydrolase [Prevotellaceae bacterium]
GLGNINLPCSWLGIVCDEGRKTLRCFEQLNNDTVDTAITLPKDGRLWLRLTGDYDNDQAQYAYSLNGTDFQEVGPLMQLSYQLITFQGSRPSLFCFNHKQKQGGTAEFDNFTVQETEADRSGNIPYGKTFRVINLADGKPMLALPHGLMYDTDPQDHSPQTLFHIVDRGSGKVLLQCEDGRYVFVSGLGLPGDVRLTTDEGKAEEFLWQDYLGGDFMLMSLRTHTYIGKSPTTGSPYSMDFKGADPNRVGGAVLRWEEQ